MAYSIFYATSLEANDTLVSRTVAISIRELRDTLIFFEKLMITTFDSECFFFSNLTKDHVYLELISHEVRKKKKHFSEAYSFNTYKMFITHFRRERLNQLTDIRKSKSKMHQQNNKIKIFYYHRLLSDLNNSRFLLNEEVELIVQIQRKQ